MSVLETIIIVVIFLMLLPFFFDVLEIVIIVIIGLVIISYFYYQTPVLENLEQTGYPAQRSMQANRPNAGYAAQLSVPANRNVQNTRTGQKYDFSMEPSVADVPSLTRDVKVNNTPNAIMATKNDWVTEHNRIRADVGQKPVRWNQNIANGATEYAKKCVFQHANQRTLGENLAMGSPSSRYDDKTMVKMWESEKKDYKHPSYPRITSPGETGHYTQMVNKNVSEIGCGCSECGKSRMCVCRYDKIQIGNQYPY